MYNLVKKFSERIRNGRTNRDVINYLYGEYVELHEEVFAETPGEDGVMGEAVDVILIALDMIYLDNPSITQEEIEAYMLKKCEKWERLYG